MDIGVYLMGRKLDVRIMIGAGVCKTFEELVTATKSPCGGIVGGSGTVDERWVHEGETFHWNGYRSVNSLGLPNPGLRYYFEHLKLMVNHAHDHGKAFHFSIAGNTADEFVTMAELARDAKVDCIEVNLGCPNIWSVDRRQQQILTYQPWSVYNILTSIREEAPKVQISAKFSPHFDRSLLEETALLFRKEPELINAVVVMNTVPNVRPLKPNGSLLLVPEVNGYCGLGGPAIMEIGLGQVAMWRSELPRTVQITGMGGVSSGQDVVDYVHAGADAVAMTSFVIKSGDIDPGAVERVVMEFVDLVDKDNESIKGV